MVVFKREIVMKKSCPKTSGKHDENLISLYRVNFPLYQWQNISRREKSHWITIPVWEFLQTNVSEELIKFQSCFHVQRFLKRFSRRFSKIGYFLRTCLFAINLQLFLFNEVNFLSVRLHFLNLTSCCIFLMIRFFNYL